MENKSSKIASLLKILLPFALVYFIYPVADKEYSGFWFGGFTGSIHGGTWIYNWIYSFFDSTHLLKASNSSGWYSFCWWTTAIINSFALLMLTLTLFGVGVLSIFSLFKKNK